jgi:hypothetical protein
MSNRTFPRSGGSTPHSSGHTAAQPHLPGALAATRTEKRAGPPAQNAVRTRLLHDPTVQRAFVHVHQCGPRPAAELLCELLDAVSADPAILDRALDWLELDPDDVQRKKAHDFHKSPLDPIPDDAGGA